MKRHGIGYTMHPPPCSLLPSGHDLWGSCHHLCLGFPWAEHRGPQPWSVGESSVPSDESSKTVWWRMDGWMHACMHEWMGKNEGMEKMGMEKMGG